jgi:cobalamin 5'-phosphate synthase/cobalamin synthase
MKKILEGFALSLNMLSIIPFFKVHTFFRGINGYAVMFYPVVGFLLGTILYGVFLSLESHIPKEHLGVIVFALWVLLSGGLHLDGFCDTIDGLFVKKEKALLVMKDSHIGGMGMIFGGVFLILKASSLMSFESFYLLPYILMLSRFNASLAIYFYPYISKGGIGEMAKAEFTQKQLFFISVVVLGFAMWISLMLFITSLLVLFVCGRLFVKRYGGFSGDMYGFVIEVSELILLNVALVAGL